VSAILNVHIYVIYSPEHSFRLLFIVFCWVYFCESQTYRPWTTITQGFSCSDNSIPQIYVSLFYLATTSFSWMFSNLVDWNNWKVGCFNIENGTCSTALVSYLYWDWNNIISLSSLRGMTSGSMSSWEESFFLVLLVILRLVVLAEILDFLVGFLSSGSYCFDYWIWCSIEGLLLIMTYGSFKLDIYQTSSNKSKINVYLESFTFFSVVSTNRLLLLFY